MGFVTLEEIAPLISVGVLKALTADSAKFETAESQAAIIIRDITGLAIPDDERPATADWVVTPAAWIIQFLAANLVTGASPELERRYESQWRGAHKILENHPLEKRGDSGDKTYALSGTIGGMYE